jgi:hypothetical protein
MAFTKRASLFCLMVLWLTNSRIEFTNGEYLDNNNIMGLSGSALKNVQFKEWQREIRVCEKWLQFCSI